MSEIHIWFPNYMTEAHKRPWQGSRLVSALAKYGIYCEPTLTERAQLIFCGSFNLAAEIRRQSVESGLPVVHYNWDLYPFQVEGRHSVDYGGQWIDYVEDLKTCAEVIVPSKCTIDRTVQFTGRSAAVVKSALKPFTHRVSDGGYVLNAMRDYDDSNKTAARDACESLGIPFINSGNDRPWEEYMSLVANCRLIVSAQYEASTGGLSLLEAYALGKPVLCSNSPRHGAVDYFGDRAPYFQWDDPKDLRKKIKQLYTNPPKLNQMDCWNWVSTEYSDRRMARQLADVFRNVLGQPNNYLTPETHIDPFQQVQWYQDETGYIVWRAGTGLNIELLHLNAQEHRKGYGTALVRKMLSELKSDQPYHSVFGFTRETNEDAIAFYRTFGFNLTPVADLYREGSAVMFHQSYTALMEKHFAP